MKKLPMAEHSTTSIVIGMKRDSVEASLSRSQTSGRDAKSDRIAELTAKLSASSDLNPLIDLTEEVRQGLLQQTDNRGTKNSQKGLRFLVRSIQALIRDDRIPLQVIDERGYLQIAKGKGVESAVDGGKTAVQGWLQGRWNDIVELLCQLLRSNDDDVGLLSLDLLMQLQQDASSALCRQTASKSDSGTQNTVQWSHSPWLACMDEILGAHQSLKNSVNQLSTVSDIVLGAFTDKYLQQYDDVRLAFCRYVYGALQSRGVRANSIRRQNALQVLLPLTAIPTEQKHLDTFWVKEMENRERSNAKAKKPAKPVETNREEASDLEDWFSDSDEEAGGADSRGKAAGLGRAARDVAEKTASQKRLRRNPAFCDAVHSLSAQRIAFSRAWLAVLLPSRTSEGQVIGGGLIAPMVHEALVRMHSQILPHLSNPNLLHDFLVDALDAGGATALLALNTLFTLMTKHNLNYPSFYARLYALLLADPPVLHVRYRSRFLRMLDIFLSSTHLPAMLIASFAKRLSRIALRAPAAAIVVIIPFVWNLCKRHKHCLGLLHREFGNDRLDMGPAGLPDPYDATETDPLKTNAIESSLWELAAMGAQVGAVQQTGATLDAEGQVHYLASVSSLSRILAEPFTKERYGLEDFLDLTYGTMFETEANKTLKKREGRKVVEPAVAFKLPTLNSGKRADTFAMKAPLTERTSKRAKFVADEQQEEEDDADVPVTDKQSDTAPTALLNTSLFVF